jgi:intraflagellar transport protein 80
MTGHKSLSVRNVSNDAWEKLEFPDRVIKLALGYGHLVVVTPSQCHIYTTKNWNTPVIFDLREGSVCMLLLAERLVSYYVCMRMGRQH